jgi:hypothetical protein
MNLLYQVKIEFFIIYFEKIKMPEYKTHFNGGRIYRVVIKSNTRKDDIIKVYKNECKYGSCDGKFNKLLQTYISGTYFIGKSPKNKMTSYSGGYGSEFDGNSILVKLNEGENKYVFIGDKMFTFETLYEIKDFVSPVGNNDVPYPYAIDVKENCYLMIENVILLSYGSKKEPYWYYYDRQIIVNGKTNINRKAFLKNYKGIENFYLGDSNSSLY